MSNYFRDFPIIWYDPEQKKRPKKCINLTVRFKLLERLKQNSTIYYEYSIKDGERPDTIAAKYYGDANYNWVVMLVNDIHDVDYDWPLSQRNLTKYIVDKYGSLPSAQAQTHHYERIIAAETTTTAGIKVPERNVEVDLTTYSALAPSSRRKVNMYDWEIEVNETKRNIKLIDKRYLDQLVEEFETIFEE